MDLSLIPVNDTSHPPPSPTVWDGGERVPIYYGSNQVGSCPEAYRKAMAAIGYDFNMVQLQSQPELSGEPRSWLEFCVCLSEAAFIHNGFRLNYDGGIGWNDMLGDDTTSSVTVKTRGDKRTIFYHKSCTPLGYPRRCSLYGYGEDSHAAWASGSQAESNIRGFLITLITNLKAFNPAAFDGLPQIATVPVFDSQVTFAENPHGDSGPPPDFPARGAPNKPPSQYDWNATYNEWRARFGYGNGYSDAWMTGTYPYAS